MTTGSHEPRAVVPPIYQSTTFTFTDKSYDDIVRRGGLRSTWYTRFGNPTVSAAAAPIAALEGGEQALLTASGMADIATTLVTLCGAGDRIVAAQELYGDTRDLLIRDLPALGIRVDFVPVTDLGEWERALAAGPVRLAYAETISNPQLRMLDVAGLAGLAHAAGALLVVDNTFASPAVVRPLGYGADVVVNSVTKFLNGHSDVVAGAIVTGEERALDIQRRIVTFGACADPHAAFLVRRGLDTFELRLARQNATAAQLARELAGLDGVVRVIHPTRDDYEWRDLARRQCLGGSGGAVVSAVLDGGDARAGRFMRALTRITEATSLGGVESLVSAPYNSSHFSLSVAEREAFGISAGMVRLSVGLEPPESLLVDIAGALRVSAAPPGP
jgi:methionine-gamma-lyase